MNIILVMSDTSMWKPRFIEDLIKSLPAGTKIVGAVLTGFGYETYGILGYLKKYFTLLGPKYFIFVSLKNTITWLRKTILRLAGKPERLSIAGVCRIYQIPAIATNSINNYRTIQWIAEKKPDVLYSSGHQIFSGELLSIPSKCCINRHSSLLPAYRGIYPLFWNLLNEEKQAGVSVHTMEKEIDKGKVVAQKSFGIQQNDTLFTLFDKCYEISVELTLEALAKIESGNWQPVCNGILPSYYTFPNRQQARLFRRKGKRIL